MTSASRRASRPATGTRWRRYWPTTFRIDDRRRVVNAGVRRGRDAEIANMRAIADLGVTRRDVDRHRDPRRAPRPHRVRFSGRDQRPEAFHTEVLGIVEIDADEPDRGTRRVRPRRHRRRLRGTRRPVPRRRSRRPRAHVVGHRAGLRRAQPARTPCDDAGLGEHRPPASDNVRARRHDRIHPRHVGRHAGHQHLYRGRASAEQPRSGRHPAAQRDLATGLRGRVADDRPL